MFWLGLAIGAWVGWAVGRRPRTVAVAQPARPFTYTDAGTWRVIGGWPMPADTNSAPYRLHFPIGGIS